jgi:hypothetical protein
MKLYLLEEKEDAPPNNIGGYDTFERFVIRARNPEEARLIASDMGGNEWLNPKITICKVINSRDGEQEVICASFNAG